MATTTKESFKEFASNINITDRQEGVVANCKANVIAKIKAKLQLHGDEARVIGSWDRDTLTRYLSEGDVDVMVILHYDANKGWNTAEGTARVLQRFKEILDEAYPKTPCGVDRNCVTMGLSEFRLDVVPAFQLHSGGYTIPDTYRKQWIGTDPVKFAALMTQVNKNMDGCFKPLIKMVKAWNRDVGKPLRGFHMECILYERYKSYSQSYSYDSMICRFFEALPEYLKYPCYDPVTGDQVDAYLGPNVLGMIRQRVVAKANKAATLALEAFNDEAKYPITAIGEWKELLGEFFPAYS
jgi:hypothetical protein